MRDRANVEAQRSEPDVGFVKPGESAKQQSKGRLQRIEGHRFIACQAHCCRMCSGLLCTGDRFCGYAAHVFTVGKLWRLHIPRLVDAWRIDGGNTKGNVRY